MAWVLAASQVPDVWIVEQVARAWEIYAPWVLVRCVVLAGCGTIGLGT